jgi:hypothetical protein
MIALVDHNCAIDEHKRHAFRVLLRVFLGGWIRNRVGVEHNNVSPKAFFEQAAIF